MQHPLFLSSYHIISLPLSLSPLCSVLLLPLTCFWRSRGRSDTPYEYPVSTARSAAATWYARTCVTLLLQGKETPQTQPDAFLVKLLMYIIVVAPLDPRRVRYLGYLPRANARHLDLCTQTEKKGGSNLAGTQLRPRHSSRAARPKTANRKSQTTTHHHPTSLSATTQLSRLSHPQQFLCCLLRAVDLACAVLHPTSKPLALHS